MKLFKVFAFAPEHESGVEFEKRVQAFLDDAWQPLGISPTILLLQKTLMNPEEFDQMKKSFEDN